MFTLQEFEKWAIGKDDFIDDIIVPSRFKRAKEAYLRRHHGDPIMATRRLVMLFFDLDPLEFEKIYWPRVYAASMEVKLKKLEATMKVQQAASLKKASAPKQTSAPKPASAPKQAPTVTKAPPTRRPTPISQAPQQKPPPPPYAYELEALSTQDLPKQTSQLKLPVNAYELENSTNLFEMETPTNVLPSFKPTKRARLDVELREYHEATTKDALAYALFNRGRISPEEYAQFCVDSGGP